ncbi:hypothetical protein RRG08_042202 [Elysia crispata]|uniref:MADF domain-containing protein n=1 Tax=Elysia crispata TaxID=231223 RepID=A0AAE1BE34_9GAST|nr:hypothetical protein RRG08_042202 [Elysia crispata]
MEQELLISAVQKRPALYDKTDKNYSNRNYITTEWKKIAEEVGCNGLLVTVCVLSSLIFSETVYLSGSRIIMKLWRIVIAFTISVADSGCTSIGRSSILHI